MLPKTRHPIFETTLPSTKKRVNYRQMLVRDEKILLIAKESEDESDIYRAVKQVVNNCMFDTNIDKLTTFDIEYMFLKIRSVSISNVIEIKFRDMEDETDYNFTINLDDVNIVYPDSVEQNIKLETDEGEVVVKLRYPPASLYESNEAINSDSAYEFIASKCLDSIYSGDEVTSFSDYSEKELIDFIYDLDTKSYQAVKDFISNMPRLNYVIEYTNSNGTERKIVLTSLTDFFTLR